MLEKLWLQRCRDFIDFGGHSSMGLALHVEVYSFLEGRRFKFISCVPKTGMGRL